MTDKVGYERYHMVQNRKTNISRKTFKLALWS